MITPRSSKLDDAMPHYGWYLNRGRFWSTPTRTGFWRASISMKEASFNRDGDRQGEYTWRFSLENADAGRHVYAFQKTTMPANQGLGMHLSILYLPSTLSR